MVTEVGKGIVRAHGGSHFNCMVTEVGKGIVRAHGESEVRPQVRRPLSWDLLTEGRRSVAEVETEGG